MALPTNVASAKTKLQAGLTSTFTTAERDELVALVDNAQAIADKKAEIVEAQEALVVLFGELKTLEEA